MGIELTTEPEECTLLCAPRILRTRKFLAALAVHPTVVSTAYLDYALQHKKLNATEAFPLIDRGAEERFGIRLEKSIDRAIVNKQRLLRGWTIYVTVQVPGGLATYQHLVKMNGGNALPYTGRDGLAIQKRRKSVEEDEDAGPESQNQGGDEETQYAYLVSGTEKEDVKIWDAFREAVRTKGMEPRITKTDWLLNLCMDQRISWDERWELKEDLVPGVGHRRR